MNILALDTATGIFSIALSSGEGIYFIEIDAGQKHSEILMDGIQGLMERAFLAPGDLDGVVCMEGPGSFTGLRIGFAAAKGLALALGIPMGAVPTLDCMAAPLSFWPGIVMPVIDAKKNSFFTAFYRGEDRISDFLDMDAPAIAAKTREFDGKARDIPLLLTGPDADMLKEKLRPYIPENRILIDPECRRGRGRELLEIALKHTILNIKRVVFSGPLYLRKSDAELHNAPWQKPME